MEKSIQPSSGDIPCPTLNQSFGTQSLEAAMSQGEVPMGANIFSPENICQIKNREAFIIFMKYVLVQRWFFLGH